MVGQHVGLRGGAHAGVNGVAVASEGLAPGSQPVHMPVGPAQQRPIGPGSGHGALPNGQAHQVSWGLDCCLACLTNMSAFFAPLELACTTLSCAYWGQLKILQPPWRNPS